MFLGLLKAALLSSTSASGANGLDTALKRRMASGVAFLPLGPSVTPNVDKDTAWRRQVAWSYLQLVPGGDGNTFNVMDYGAVGDGVFDDTPATRAALAAAIASSDQDVTVYFPTPPASYSLCRQSGDAVWPTWPVILNVAASNKTIRFLGDGEALSVVNCFMPGLTDPETSWVNTGDGYVKIARFTAFDVSGTNLTVIFEDITVDGQTAYTGNHAVGGSTTTGDGWDITHKCVRIAAGSNIAVILRGGATMRNWRGEVIWGGNHNALVTLEAGATLTGSNASALSVTNCNVDQAVIGGADALLVYNGIENFAFDDETTIVTNSTIRAAANGIVPIGSDGSTCTITGNTFNNCNNAILISEGCWGLLVDDCDFNSCANGIINSFLNLYPGQTNGFGNWTISNNRQQGSASATLLQGQGQTIQGYLTVSANTISAGSLIGGSFNATTNFTAPNNILNGGKDVSSNHSGVAALWSGTVRTTVPELNSAGVKIDSFTGASSININSLTDLVALNDNATVGPIALTVNNVANIPAGQIITFKRYGSDANWVLPAAAWNNFGADIPINGDPVVLIKEGSILSEYAINNGYSSLLASDFLTTTESYTDGLYWLRPYDMLNDFGAAGAALAAANKRYVWLVSSDHYNPNITNGFHWAGGVWRGWSHDPTVLPDKFEMFIWQELPVPGRIGNFFQLETPFLMWNPDTSEFNLYMHGEPVSDGNHGQETVLFTSPDFVTWTAVGVSHATTLEPGHVGYQTVYRNGPGDWHSFGLGGLQFNLGVMSRWSSTDGVTFSKGADLARTIGSRSFIPHHACYPVTIDGQSYMWATDDDRIAGNGMGATLMPLQADGDIDTADVNDLILVAPPTGRHDGVYPGPGYVQSASGYEEDGVFIGTVERGFYSNTGIPDPEDVAYYQTTDIYAVITDAVAAAGAAPMGVRASCAAGIVSVLWYDILPQGIYRVDTSTSASGPWTDQGDFSGGSATVNLGDLDALRYVRLTKLAGGIDQQSRIVPIWVSAASATANKHLTRVATTGGNTATVDVAWLDAVITYLTSNNLDTRLLQWSDPGFGVDATGDLVCYDLAATINPRARRDWCAATSGSTYNATAISGDTPGVTSAVSADYGHFAGRSTERMYNNHRKISQLTLASAYARTQTGRIVLITTGGDASFTLDHNSGTPGTARFGYANFGTYSGSVTGTPAATNNVIIGRYDGTNLNLKTNGTDATPVAFSPPNVSGTPYLNGQRGVSSPVWTWGQGVQQLKFGRTTSGMGVGGSFVPSSNLSRLSWMSLIGFDVALTDTQASDLHTLLNGRMA